jgi:hypothetical protein
MVCTKCLNGKRDVRGWRRPKRKSIPENRISRGKFLPHFHKDIASPNAAEIGYERSLNVYWA